MLLISLTYPVPCILKPNHLLPAEQAPGLFMMMANGLGAFLGSRISGIIIDNISP